MISTVCRGDAFAGAQERREFRIVRTRRWVNTLRAAGIPTEPETQLTPPELRPVTLNLVSGGRARRWKVRRIECHPWGWFFSLGEEVPVPSTGSLFSGEERRRA